MLGLDGLSFCAGEFIVNWGNRGNFPSTPKFVYVFSGLDGDI